MLRHYKILLLLLLIGASVGAYAQSYYVVRLNGKIKNLSQNKSLEIKDKLNVNDKIKFVDKNATAILLHPKNGRFVLKANVKENNTTEFQYHINNIISSQHNQRMSVREVDMSELGQKDGQTQLGSFLNYHKKLLLIKERRVKVTDPEFYNNSGKNSFFLQVVYDDDIVDVNLKFEDSTIILNKKDLLTVDGKMMQTEVLELVTLHHRLEKNGKVITKEIAAFTISIPKGGRVKNEISMIAEILGDSSEKKLQEEVKKHLYDLYGHVDDDELAAIGL